MLAAKRLSRELRKNQKIHEVELFRQGLRTGEGVRLDLDQNFGRNEGCYLHH
jgi:hypothetical protein